KGHFWKGSGLLCSEHISHPTGCRCRFLIIKLKLLNIFLKPYCILTFIAGVFVPLWRGKGWDFYFCLLNNIIYSFWCCLPPTPSKGGTKELPVFLNEKSMLWENYEID